MIFGSLFFVAAASIPETLSNFVSSRHLMVLERVVEEIGEMVGITFVLWGTLGLLADRNVRLEFVKVVRDEESREERTNPRPSSDVVS